MATRALITTKNEYGEFLTIYNHWDGDPEFLGATLQKHYLTEEKRKTLFKKGDVSFLAPTIEESQFFRDRGDRNTEPTRSRSQEQAREQEKETWVEYHYFWDDEKRTWTEQKQHGGKTIPEILKGEKNDGGSLRKKAAELFNENPKAGVIDLIERATSEDLAGLTDQEIVLIWDEHRPGRIKLAHEGEEITATKGDHKARIPEDELRAAAENHETNEEKTKAIAQRIADELNEGKIGDDEAGAAARILDTL